MKIRLATLAPFITFALFLVAIFWGQNVLVSPSHPVEDIDKLDITFPIPELGNCADWASCMKYCQDPVNYSACIEFAKKKGFYHEDPIYVSDDEFLKKAKDELGCDSIESCMRFCEDPANFEKCNAFAKKLKIAGGYIDEPDKPEYLKIAKDVLGCDSLESCKTVCDDPTNTQKCTDFAHQVGLLGGQGVEGPGGCVSEETCRSFCSDPNNFNECSKFAPAGTGFRGPGGCDDPGECRSYCEQNPDQCRSYAPGSNGAYVPISCSQGEYFGPGGVCTKVEKSQEAGQCASQEKFWDGDSCNDQPPPGVNPTVGGAYFQPRPEMGNCNTPAECYDYCQANPGKCAGFDPNAPKPENNYIPHLYYTPGTEVKFEPIKEYGNCDSPGECYDYCKENPEKCAGFNPNSPRPPDTYVPGTYYTPPSDYAYATPPASHYYVTPVYYTPPPGSGYTTPTYYTPGTYTTPTYYTPPPGSNYPTPSYYTPHYYTPSSNYPTPSYYTPPPGYTTPTYPTPPEGSNYSTPSYYTPGSYPTPSYYTPSGTYSTPSYYTPGYSYPSPSYYTPGYSYPSPTYGTPTYGTPTYETPTYGTPTYGTPTYETPSYSYPTPSEVHGAQTKQNFFQTIWNFLFGGR